MSSSNTRRLAKNTVFMYIRMVFLMVVSFYSSRVVLKELGVDDYGTYNVVGGIVAMFSSLRTIFSSSTQRFLNTEMGRHNYENLSIIFNTSIYVNIIISLVFIIAAEFIGLWFLQTKINISADRLFAAQWVLQLSIASAVLNIMTTTFDAEIVAHERLDFYAFVSILEGLLKLGAVCCLPFIDYDKLIMYGVLILAVSFIIRLINSWFCKRNFPECRIKLTWNVFFFRRMTSFAGWNFFGNTAYALSQNGINMIMNVFGGPAVNAARGIAYQLSSSLNQIVQNVNVVVTPYFTKTYASGDTSKAFSLFYLSSKVFFLFQYCIVTVIFFHTEALLSLWLENVPKYTCVFLKLILLHSLIRSLHSPLDTLFKSVGNLKWYQLCEGVMLSFPVVASYLLLQAGCEYYSVFIAIIVFELLNFLLIILIAKRICKLSLKDYFSFVVLKCSFLFSLFIITYFVDQQISSIFYKIVCTMVSLIISFMMFWVLCLNNSERKSFSLIIKRTNEK